MSIKYNGGYIPAVGADGTTLVADSSTSTGLRYNPTTGNLNFVINGGFDIWQRSTSSSANGYATADRWNRDANACTTSQQTTGAPNGSRYVLRNTFTSASSAYATQLYFMETADASRLWGQTVTLSVKLRRSSGMASNLQLYLRKNATVDAGPATGSWATISFITISNASLPTGTTSADWYTATITATIPNDGTANSLNFFVATVSEPGNGSYWEMAQAKLEIGSVATTFSRAGGTLQGELAACQRYYWQSPSTVAYTPYGFGSFISTTVFQAPVKLPVSMRIIPTLATSNALAAVNASAAALTSVSVVGAQSSVDIAYISASGTGTLNAPATLANNNTSGGYLGLSAEL